MVLVKLLIKTGLRITSTSHQHVFMGVHYELESTIR